MAKPKPEPELKQACVLAGFALDHVDYNPYDIIEAPAEIIKSLGTAVDTDPQVITNALNKDGAVIKTYKPTDKSAVESKPEGE